MYKQDLAMAYFPDHSNVAPNESRESLLTMPSLSNVTEGKESASKRLANEIHSNFHFSPFNFQFFSSPLSYLSNLSSLSNPSPTLPIPIPNAPSPPPLHGNRAKGGLISAFRSFLSEEKKRLWLLR